MNARFATMTQVWLTVAFLAGWPAVASAEAGSIVAWECGDPLYDYGQCDVPAPNTDFVAVAGGDGHSLVVHSISVCG